MKVTIIGDVHGKVNRYKQIVDNCDFSICVGDFGFKEEWDWAYENVYHEGHRIVMGNHDYLPYLNSSPFSIGNYEHWIYPDIFMVRGAFSIDRVYRIEGLDWFVNEELTYEEGLKCFDLYAKCKPKIVISHECPHSIRKHLFGIDRKSNTSNLLQALFEEHQPDLWVFGHHHRSKRITVGKTEFVCLAELETIEL